MLTQTSELAFRTLLFLSLEGDSQPIPPRQIAESLQCSPSYLSKTLRKLVRAGVLRSVRGAHGGVVLALKPGQITLLSVVEACQGLLIANYCRAIAGHEEPVCGFHRAVRELHNATVEILSRWTLQDLLEPPMSCHGDDPPCRMSFPEAEKHVLGKTG